MLQLCRLPVQAHRAIVELNESSFNTSSETTSRVADSRIMHLFQLIERVTNQVQSENSTTPIILNSVLEDAGEWNCVFSINSRNASNVSVPHYLMDSDRVALLEVDSTLYDPIDDDQLVRELAHESNLNIDNLDLLALYMGEEPPHIKQSTFITRFDTTIASTNDAGQTSLFDESHNIAARTAAAGFFYSSGVFICYSCNASLSNVIDIEQVWSAHKPTCGHLLRSKGTSFVSDTLHVSNRNTELGHPNQLLYDTGTESSFLDSTIFKKHFRCMCLIY